MAAHELYTHRLPEWSDLCKIPHILPDTSEAIVNAFRNHQHEDLYSNTDDVNDLNRRPSLEFDRQNSSQDSNSLTYGTPNRQDSSSLTYGTAHRQPHESPYSSTPNGMLKTQDDYAVEGMHRPGGPMQSAGRRQARAMYSHVGSGETQLSFAEGDLLSLVGERREGWQYGENTRTHRLGWFPISFTEPVGHSQQDNFSLTQQRVKSLGNLTDLRAFNEDYRMAPVQSSGHSDSDSVSVRQRNHQPYQMPRDRPMSMHVGSHTMQMANTKHGQPITDVNGGRHPSPPPSPQEPPLPPPPLPPPLPPPNHTGHAGHPPPPPPLVHSDSHQTLSRNPSLRTRPGAGYEVPLPHSHQQHASATHPPFMHLAHLNSADMAEPPYASNQQHPDYMTRAQVQQQQQQQQQQQHNPDYMTRAQVQQQQQQQQQQHHPDYMTRAQVQQAASNYVPQHPSQSNIQSMDPVSVTTAASSPSAAAASPDNSSSGYSSRQGSSSPYSLHRSTPALHPGPASQPSPYDHGPPHGPNALPPPPPPNMAPPPPPKGHPDDSASSLFSNIRLKRTVTNDRSAPKIY